ncbi:MAG: Multicopper oxidase [Candidatus Saccharicenans subterraneus]|uniref:Multicopper oxidase n=1 Tax=Candidatus Saccharicenans subterraneus TaxID=2508984 RepID=A0A3E2BJ75_9BACT|nr:MAG: Multicopper oxidase [Candidatus Saccharicenans subterraneum]
MNLLSDNRLERPMQGKSKISKYKERRRMMRKKLAILISLLFLLAVLPWGVEMARAKQTKGKPALAPQSRLKAKFELNAQRKAAAVRFKQLRSTGRAKTGTLKTMATAMAMMEPGAAPHYFGPYPNYANSPMPKGSVAGIVVEAGGGGYSSPVVTIEDLYTGITGITPATATAMVDATGAISGIMLLTPGAGYTAPVVSITDPTGSGAWATASIGPPFVGGIRKFVDPLPGLPVAVPDTTTYPGSDYYEIELGQFSQKMHSDLPPTLLRGYRQTNTVGPASQFNYMAPTIVARRDRPVRIKFTNSLPTGSGGNLFIPVDPTVMGAGMGPTGEMYTQNRAAVHLHGNNTVWISDGTPHQWITPAGETTAYPKGVSVYNVPDMPDPGDGSMTIYYTNAHSARLMFYHDHSYGITRLNVYAGEAAGYLVTDQVEEDMINGTNLSGVNPLNVKVLPDLGIPLIIQDRTFVDAATIPYQDPTWSWGSMPGMPMTGDLWYPHVYMPNQNPDDPSGMNAFGRWHYGPWFWPPTTNIAHGPVPNPYYDPINAPWEPRMNPGVPHPSMAMEAFMDTPVVNGMAYPYLEVEPRAYRFRILNAADDRFLNLQLYVADPAVTTADGRTGTEVKMVPAVFTPGFPPGWPKDGRDGGVPDPATAGPPFIQIGTEGGFLPAPVVLPMQPVDWNMDQTNFDMGLVNKGTLILGTAERADVIIDFSAYAGKTLILYNDSPAPFPALDTRYDYYTGNPDQTDVGGTPTTQAGYGPNTRTIMQIRVANTGSGPAYDLNALKDVFAKTADKNGVFEVSQDEIIVPEARYNSAYNLSFVSDPYVRIFEYTKSFQTVSGLTVPDFPLQPKAMQDEMGETFDPEYGRMSANLGLQLPFNPPGAQNFILLPYASPPVEIIKNTVFGTQIGEMGDGTQIWKITHNGVDTHTIHVHLFNAQLINRVAWDNAIRPPEANELGWKETFRVNPLQDTIIALRPIFPEAALPFDVPNSIRPIDPTMPIGAVLPGGPGGFKDPNANPVTVINRLINFGWEYVYHCHILAHEEMDMMHSMAFAVAPRAPINLKGTVTGNGANRRVILTWTDNSLNETGFVVQRSATSDSPWATLAGLAADVTTYTDPIGNTNAAYFYRVFATNTVGDTGTPGFPTLTVESGYAGPISVGQQQVQPPAAPTNLTATLQAGPQVLLNWTDNANNETGFVIERQAGGGAFAALVTVGPRNGTGSVSYTDTSVVTATSYAYRVAAANAAGMSAYSNTANVNIPAPAAAPTNVVATAQRVGNGPNDRITVTWTDVANETGYTIEYATNSTFTANLVTTTVGANVTTFQTGNLARNTAFYVRIRATNGAGPSAWVNATPFPIITP